MVSGQGKGGKLGVLKRRRLRAGSLSVPVEHPEMVRGERVRNAMKLKELVGKFYDESRAREVHCDVDAYEPLMKAEVRKPEASGGRALLLSRLDDSEDLEDE